MSTYFHILPIEVMNLILSYIPIEYIDYFNFAIEKSEEKIIFNSVKQFFHADNAIVSHENSSLTQRFFDSIINHNQSASLFFDKLDTDLAFLPESAIEEYMRHNRYFAPWKIHSICYPSEVRREFWEKVTKKLIALYTERRKNELERRTEVTDKLIALCEERKNMLEQQIMEIEAGNPADYRILEYDLAKESEGELLKKKLVIINNKLAKQSEFSLLKKMIKAY